MQPYSSCWYSSNMCVYLPLCYGHPLLSKQTHAGWVECEDTQHLRPSSPLPDAQQCNIPGAHQRWHVSIDSVHFVGEVFQTNYLHFRNTWGAPASMYVHMSRCAKKKTTKKQQHLCSSLLYAHSSNRPQQKSFKCHFLKYIIKHLTPPSACGNSECMGSTWSLHIQQKNVLLHVQKKYGVKTNNARTSYTSQVVYNL